MVSLDVPIVDGELGGEYRGRVRLNFHTLSRGTLRVAIKDSFYIYLYFL